MSPTVLLVGPCTVHAPHPVPGEMVCAAIDAIDDEHVLVDERPVAVDEVWARVIAVASGGRSGTVLLVCPGWWSDARVARIRGAAAQNSDEPVIVRRHETHRSAAACVIEIAPDFVLCRMPGSPVAATPRLGGSAGVAATVAHGIVGAGPVVIDAPVGVPGAAALVAALVQSLRGHDVRIVDDATLAAAVEQWCPPAPAPRRRRRPWPVAAGVLLALGALLGPPRTAGPGGQPTTLLTEGRVTVRIPVGWVVRRITDDAGSARIQAFSPSEESAAILLTQSEAGPDLMGTAAVIEAALALQPPGVFTGLRTDEQRGGRPVLSYTERRAGREISWAVFLDGRARIAVGCQQPTSGAVIRQHCDEAIRSAHAAP